MISKNILKKIMFNIKKVLNESRIKINLKKLKIIKIKKKILRNILMKKLTELLINLPFFLIKEIIVSIIFLY